MDKYIVNRVLEEASYMLEHKSTVRDIANIYKVSKSTVHSDGTKWNVLRIRLCG